MSNKPDAKWPRFEPEVAPYFEAAEQGKLVIKRCLACTKAHFYPRAHCPHCFSAETEWLPASGLGVVYSFTVIQRGETPTIVAYVTLAEGPKMLTNIVDCPPEAVSIGRSVRVGFREQPDGVAVPVFHLAEEAQA